MNRREAIQQAAETYAAVIETHTRPGRARTAALELIRKSIERANTAVIVDKLKPAAEGASER